MANDTDMADDPGRKAVGGSASGDSAGGDSAGSDAALNDEDLTTKDRAYSPASERETEVKQNDQSTHAPDVDTEDVDLLPGTGGPDDNGQVDVDPGEIHRPQSDAPSTRPV